MHRWKTFTAAMAAGICAVAGLAGCGGDDTLDKAELEDELRVQLSEDAGVDPDDVTVECPDDIEAEAGREFQCELTAPNGDLVSVEVTLTDDDGSFEAIVPAAAVRRLTAASTSGEADLSPWVTEVLSWAVATARTARPRR